MIITKIEIFAIDIAEMILECISRFNIIYCILIIFYSLLVKRFFLRENLIMICIDITIDIFIIFNLVQFIIILAKFPCSRVIYVGPTQYQI
jgi:hypothetical protein